MQFTIVFVIGFVAVIIFAVYQAIGAHAQKLDQQARDAGSAIDTCLWDINFSIDKIVKIIEVAGKTINDEEILKTVDIGLGMNASRQTLCYVMISKRLKAITAFIDEDGDLKNNAEIEGLFKKIEGFKKEMLAYSLKYNKRAASLNSYIEKPFISFISERKRVSARNMFTMVREDGVN